MGERPGDAGENIFTCGMHHFGLWDGIIKASAATHAANLTGVASPRLAGHCEAGEFSPRRTGPGSSSGPGWMRIDASEEG